MAEDDRQHLQRYVDLLFRRAPTVTRLDAVVCAESLDLPADIVEIVQLVPPGTYTRQRLVDQLNSAIVGHGWGTLYGTVE